MLKKKETEKKSSGGSMQYDWNNPIDYFSACLYSTYRTAYDRL